MTKTGNTADAVTVEIPVKLPDAASITKPSVVLNTDTATSATNSINLSDYYTVTVDPSKVIDKQTATLNVNVKHNGAVPPVSPALTYTLTNNAGTTISSGSVVNGVATIPSVAFEGVDAAQYSYTVTVSDGTLAHDSDAVINVQKDLQNLTGADNVVFGDSRLITGTIKNTAGAAYAGAAVTLVSPSNAVTTSTTNSVGFFSLNPTFTEAGKWLIKVGGVTYKEIVVGTKPYTVAVTGTALKSFNSTMTVEVKDGNTAVDTAASNIKVYKADGTEVAIGGGFTSIGSGKYTFTSPNSLDLGTYTVKVTKSTVGAADIEFTGTATYNVVSAGKTNVTVTAGTINAGSAATIAVDVVDASNNGIVADPADNTRPNKIQKIKVVVTGVGVNTTKEKTNAGSTVTTDAFTAEQAGTLTITTTVTYWDNSVVTDVKTATVNGYKATLALGELKFNNIVAPKVTVTKADGTPVNDGRVILSATKNVFLQDTDKDGKYDDESATNSISSELNPNNGEYTFLNIKIVDVDAVTVTVKDAVSGGTVKALFSTATTGLATLSLTSATTGVVAGYSDNDVVLVPKDEAGNVIQDLSSSNFTLNGNAVTVTAVQDVTDVTKEVGYKVTGINPVDGSNKPKDQVFVVSINAGQKTGTLTIPAVLPKVTFSAADKKVTEDIREKVTITIANPITNEAKNGTVTFAAVKDTQNVPQDTATFDVDSDANGTGFGGAGASSYDAYILADDGANSTAAAKFEVLVNNVVVATFAVEKATLSAGETKELYLGVNNNFTLTLKDAHGVAIANKDIVYAGTTLSSTDANGQVSLVDFKPAATGTATFTVTGLAGVEAKLAIKVPAAKVVIAGIERDTNGYWVTVENQGIGTASNIKVQFTDGAGAVRKGYIASLAGGATTEIFVRATTTKAQTVTENYNASVPYIVKVPVTTKVAYKVKVKGKYVTKYKYVTTYKNVTKYKTVVKTRTVVKTVNFTPVVTLG